MSSLVVSIEAYVKIFLHAAKYMGNPIGGFLIGSLVGEKVSYNLCP